MDGYDMELYSVIPAEDDLGAGLDIYTSSDAFYRVRFGEEAVTTMHREDGDWSATVRYPVTEDGDGYDRFHGIAQDLDAVYDTALDRKALPFRDELSENGVVERTGHDMTLRYAPQPTIDLPEFDRRYTAREVGGMGGKMAKLTGSAGGAFGGAGAFLGGGIAAMTGEPVLDAALFGGSVLGGTMSGFIGCMGLAKLGEEVCTGTTEEVTPEEAYTRLTEEADDDSLVAPVFDRANERNRLARILDTEAAYRYDEELMDRYDELREEDDITVDVVLDVLCREAAHLEGAAATITDVDYTAVEDFLGTVTDTAPGAEPSIYRRPEAFRDVFNQLQGSEALEPTRQRFVQPIFARDVPGELEAWLEDTAPETVQGAGREHSLDTARP